jgi:hypothetical protein
VTAATSALCLQLDRCCQDQKSRYGHEAPHSNIIGPIRATGAGILDGGRLTFSCFFRG